MSDNIEKTERYLKGVVLPEHVSHQRQQQLRREVLGRIERKPTMSARVKSWKYAAVITLICTGVAAAAVVGVKIYTYHYFGRNPYGAYTVVSEDGIDSMSFGEDHVDSPEQAVEYANEISLLKQQGDRELVRVIEIELNDQLDSRLLSYEYNLSDGRTRQMSESCPDADSDGPYTLTGERRDEFFQLWNEQRRQEENGLELATTTTEERQVNGRLFSFKKWRFVLGDGTEAAWSIGRLKDD